MATFTSWIAPTPVLMANKSNSFWIMMFVSTKILQLSLIVSFGSLTREETFVGTILALVFLVAFAY